MAAECMLNMDLSHKTRLFNLPLWIIICLSIIALLILFLLMLCIWVLSNRKTTTMNGKFSLTRIPIKSKEIKTDRQTLVQSLYEKECHSHGTLYNMGLKKKVVMSTSSEADNMSQCSSVNTERVVSPYGLLSASPLIGLPNTPQLGWGHWFTLRDLECATNQFSKENVIGEGGYGVVYRGCLVNGTEIAVKRLLNNMGQAEKEFRAEVEAIGHVRHKNLVRLLGYCVEGVHRMLVYEYVNNRNLEQWLHGAMRQHGVLSWESRMKIILGIAKALAYLHEAVEPKVVHRDIKSSNVLLDTEFNGKLSDFGLAKLLGVGESHVATRVMGTFGYVAPEYAHSGLLNEKSDVYSFGILLLEVVTGREPVDYNRPQEEVNLVEWFKMMVGSRRIDELVDPNLDPKPAARIFRRILIVALKCVDPDSGNRPKMSRVVQMVETKDVPCLLDRGNRRSETTSLGSADLDNKAKAVVASVERV